MIHNNIKLYSIYEINSLDNYIKYLSFPYHQIPLMTVFETDRAEILIPKMARLYKTDLYICDNNYEPIQYSKYCREIKTPQRFIVDWIDIKEHNKTISNQSYNRIGLLETYENISNTKTIWKLKGFIFTTSYRVDKD